jgi:hypothetical protein
VKTVRLRPEYVEFIPKQLSEGVLYISMQFKTASHLCCCGCGTKIVTPLRPTEYSLTGSDDAVSLYPSIGNWNFPCQSHYWIKDGRVVVAARMTPEQILRGRQYDDAEKAIYFNRPIPWWKKAMRFLLGWFE